MFHSFLHNWNMENRVLYLALTGLVVLLFLWAFFIRKPRRERRYKYRRAPRSASTSHSKSKRRHRSQPPMNPTLAETRGLPPIREPGTTTSAES